MMTFVNDVGNARNDGFGHFLYLLFPLSAAIYGLATIHTSNPI